MVVQVTERPKKKRLLPPNVPADANIQAEIARIVKMPGWEFLRGVVNDVRERWFENFASGLAANGLYAKPADQREIDYRRGYFEGARWALEQLPYLTSIAYEKFVEDALKEAESSEE